MKWVDGAGMGGIIFDYAVAFFLAGSAVVLFIYFYKKGRLDMDEEPKYQMLHDEESDL